MKITVILAILMLFNVTAAIGAPEMQLSQLEQETNEINMQLLNTASLDHVNQFIATANRELHKDLPLLSAQTIANIAANGLNTDWKQLWQSIMMLFIKETTANLHLMGKLLFLAVLCALLQNLQNSFENSSISLLSYSTCFIFLTVIALTAFYNALDMVRQTVSTIVNFMEALLPLLLSLLAGMGAFTTAALLHH